MRVGIRGKVREREGGCESVRVEIGGGGNCMRLGIRGKVREREGG